MLTADILEENLEQGDVGTVVLVHREYAGFEVEFATLAGKAHATRVPSPPGNSEHRLPHLHWQIHLVEHPCQARPVDF